MTPTQLAAYRDSKQIPQTAQKICPKCKIRRSIAQYDKGCTKCRKCVARIPKTESFAWYVPPKNHGRYEVMAHGYWRIAKYESANRSWVVDDDIDITQMVFLWRGLSEQP